METAIQTYFIFSLNNSLFALDAVAVRETFRLPKITPVEEAPSQVVGMINLRGKLVPVTDLTICFGRHPSPYRLSDGIVVLENRNGHCFGLMVNEVHEVIDIPREDIETPPFPDRKENHQPRFVIGEVRVGEEIIMLIDHNMLAEYEEIEFAEPVKDGSNNVEPREISLPPQSFFHGLTPHEMDIFQQRAADLMVKPEEEELNFQRQVAVVSLNGEFFGIDLTSVTGFAPISNLTPIPNGPEHIVGNMNLRGNILTVIDIRGLLEMPVGTFGRSAKVVVTRESQGMVGIAVDDIDDFTKINFYETAPLNLPDQPVPGKFSKGTASYGGKLMTILDISKILRSEK